MPPPPSPSPSCPFCRIAARHRPSSVSRDSPSSEVPTNTNIADSESESGSQTHLVLATKHILAFLDIMPLTRGHLLVVPREHYRTLGEVGVVVGRELGQWLPLLSRVVMRSLFGEESSDSDENHGQSQWNWNVIQNNGITAAQVVPHVHFHIVPRPPSHPRPNAKTMSWVAFGRGQREELDDDEGAELARLLREELGREVERVRVEEGVDLIDDLSGDVDRKGKGKL